MRHIAITKQEINGADVNSVNARDLHKSLEVGKDFSSWIKQQIDRLNLVENKNFLKLTQEGEKKIEYAVDIDTAKNISLVSFTDKGQEIREYFIEVEKQSTRPQPQMTHLETARMLVQTLEAKELLENRVQEQRKVITAATDLNVKAGEVTIEQFSKNINIKGLGRNKLFTWLRGKKVLLNNNNPSQPIVDHGYMVMRPSKEKINGKYRYTTMLTPKGTIWLAKALRKAGFEVREDVA